MALTRRSVDRQVLCGLFVVGSLVVGAGSVRGQGVCSAASPEPFKVDLVRLGQEPVDDNGKQVLRGYGDLAANGVNLGRFYENPAKMIPAGTYTGIVRYRSEKGFVQSACGQMGHSGDFLLEVANVTATDGRAMTHILLHPGRLPRHSDGCILVGQRPYSSGPKPAPLPMPASSPLVKLRNAFYGTNEPNACPNKKITIVISDR